MPKEGLTRKMFILNQGSLGAMAHSVLPAADDWFVIYRNNLGDYTIGSNHSEIRKHYPAVICLLDVFLSLDKT